MGVVMTKALIETLEALDTVEVELMRRLSNKENVLTEWLEAAGKLNRYVSEQMPAILSALRQAGEAERLQEANLRLRDGYTDAMAGLNYVTQHYGRLEGVGWQRVEDHYSEWVAMPEREGFLAGSHDVAALKGTTDD
jgi:predicted HAD superfamily Cof-like phosphohydrolase